MKDITKKELSEEFCKIWKGINEDNIEKEFVDSMNKIVFWATNEGGDGEGLNESCYNLPCLYEHVTKAINKFQVLHHIVATTKY